MSNNAPKKVQPIYEVGYRKPPMEAVTIQLANKAAAGDLKASSLLYNVIQYAEGKEKEVKIRASRPISEMTDAELEEIIRTNKLPERGGSKQTKTDDIRGVRPGQRTPFCSPPASSRTA